MADGCGSVFGGAVGATLASAAYKKYIEQCQEKMKENPNNAKASESSFIPLSGYENYDYGDLEKTVSFIFCDGHPVESSDSVGYIHNSLLRRLKAGGCGYVMSSGEIDYKSMLCGIKDYASEMGFTSAFMNDISERNIIAGCSVVVKTLGKCLYDGLTVEHAFNEIETSMKVYSGFSDADATFIAVLARRLAAVMPFCMTRGNIISYCKSLNASLSESGLSEKSVSRARSLFQVAACSFLYWNSQRSVLGK